METRASGRNGVESEAVQRPLVSSVEVALFPGSRFSVGEVLQFLAFRVECERLPA